MYNVIFSLPYHHYLAYFMRNQKGLSSVVALLILVITDIIGSVGYSRQEAGKRLGNDVRTSESEVEQIRQRKGEPKKTDETTDWETYLCSKCKFSLRYPRHWVVGPIQSLDDDKGYLCTRDSSFSAGADHDLVAECGTEYFGQIYVTFWEGNQIDRHKLKNDTIDYRNITSQKVTVDGIEGTRETGTVRQDDNKLDIEHPLTNGTKVVIYLFYAHGRTYIAQYHQRIDWPDLLRDFDLMVTKTMKFGK